MSDMIEKRARRRRMTSRILIGAVLAIIVVVGASRLMRTEPGPEYRTAEVERGDIESTIVALGTIEPKDYVDVGAQVSGQLLRAHFEVGDYVEEGQLLAEIDPTVAQSRVDADEAQLREMQASRRQRMANLSLARAEARRSEALRSADAISEADAENTAAQLEIQEAQLAQLEAQIERLNFSLEEARANLNYTKIYAPMSGTVISQTTLVGQTINANQSAPTILTIADLGTMTVSADVSEADVPRLRSGMPAYFTTLGNPDREWEATVRQVLPEPEVVNDVVLYKALLDVENEDNALLPQMSAQVSFVLGEARNVVKVPAAALSAVQTVAPELAGRGDAGPAGAGPGGDMRERFQNMSEEERQAMMERFREGGGPPEGFGPPGGFGGGQGQQAQRAGRGEDGQTEQMTLLVANGETLEPREVTVGLISRTEAEIVSGLQPGEEVVLGMAAAASGDDNGGFRGPPGGFRPF